MLNRTQDGDVLTVTAPYAVSSGGGMLVGSLFCVATSAAASGATVEAHTEGVFTLSAVTADTGSVGAKIYWDNTAKKVTTTATSNTLIGCLASAKVNTDTTASVYVDGVIR